MRTAAACFWWACAFPFSLAAALLGLAGFGLVFVAGGFASLALPLARRAKRAA